MTCQECRERLTDYQHGELDAASDAAIFEHLSSCVQCREELAMQTELTESLRGAFAQELDLPMSVVAGVRQATRHERSAGLVTALRVLLRPVVLAPTAAAIMLVAGVASFVHNGSTSARPQVSAGYLVRQHVAHTMNSQSGDRAWNAYLLTSATGEDANAPAR
jgi:anti-sigma factor RsiW